jgi:hypothetical protein
MTRAQGKAGPTSRGTSSALPSGFFALALGSSIGGSACSTTPARVADHAGTDAGRSSLNDATTGTEPRSDALLIELAVEPATLVPEFSPDTHDYYVRCDAGVNAVTVSMKASPGATSRLIEPETSASLADQNVAVSVAENEAIVAEAFDGTATTEYWVRCLPHDFPQMAMTRYPDAGAPAPGYYLVGDSWLLNGESAAYAMVLDVHGVPVWYYRRAGFGVFDVDDVVPGAVTFTAGSIVPEDQPFELHDLSTSRTTLVEPSGFATDEHELRVLPNGNFVALSSPLKTGIDLTGLSLLAANGTTTELGPSSTIEDCVVVEFEPGGEVVSTWVASDHFDPAKDTVVVATAPPLETDASSDAIVYDVFHCNSIDVDPANGNLLVSARQMDSIFYVDRSTGAVLWKMGGAPYSRDAASYVEVTDPFVQQHDARLLPGWSPTCRGGSGQISLFDDESQTTARARAVVYDVVVGESDGGTGTEAGCGAGAAGTATVVWQYRGLVASAAAGSFRVEPDGSRVIGWGFGAAPDPVLTELDADGNALLRFDFPDGHVSYRAIKVPVAAFDLNVMRRTAGLP